MFCSKCCKEIPDGSISCPICGAANGNTSFANSGAAPMPVQKTDLNKIISIVLFAVAGIILILSLIACIKISGGAAELVDLHSVGGGTVAEAYYNECGAVYGGLAMFVISFGLFAGGMLSYLGFKGLKK